MRTIRVYSVAPEVAPVPKDYSYVPRLPTLTAAPSSCAHEREKSREMVLPQSHSFAPMTFMSRGTHR